MPHYVFTDDRGNPLGVMFNGTEESAARIAAELTAKRITEEGFIPKYATVTAKEVRAYLPRTAREGDTITGKAALDLPVGSIILHVADEWGAVDGADPLIRRGHGYVSVAEDGIEPTPHVRDICFYKILHIGVQP